MEILWIIAIIAICVGAFAYMLILYFQQKKQSPQSSAYLAKWLLGNPEIKLWLDENIQGERIADLKAIRAKFGLDLALAVDLLDVYLQSKK